MPHIESCNFEYDASLEWCVMHRQHTTNWFVKLKHIRALGSRHRGIRRPDIQKGLNLESACKKPCQASITCFLTLASAYFVPSFPTLCTGTFPWQYKAREVSWKTAKLTRNLRPIGSQLQLLLANFGTVQKYFPGLVEIRNVLKSKRFSTGCLRIFETEIFP